MMMRMGQQGGQQPAWYLISELKNDFDVKQLEMNVTEIPADVNWVLRVDGHTDKRPINTPADADRVMKATDAVGFVGATSLERMGIEASLTNLTKEFKSLKAPAAKKFGKKAK
jgi:hypothetical protein